MNAIQFIKEHGVDRAREVIEGAPETATHFTEALGGHYAKEGILKMKPQWLWFNSINKEWYYDFAAKDHIHLPDLKRIVDSVDVINELGSLKSAKANLREMYSDSSCDWVHENARLYDYKHLTVGRVKQAIADYEAIYSGEGQ